MKNIKQILYETINAYLATYLYFKGILHYFFKHYSVTINCMNKALEIIKENNIESDDSCEYCYLGWSYYNSEDYQQALYYFDKAVEINDKEEIYYEARADAKMALGYYKSAIDDIDKSLEFSPKNAILYNQKGECEIYLDNYLDAIKSFDKAIELNKKTPNIYYNRGIAKHDTGNYKGAIEDFSKAIKLNPKDSEYYHMRGNSKTWLDDWDGAIEDYKLAIKYNNKYSPAYLELAYVYSYLGKKSLAMHNINFAINLADGNAEYYVEKSKILLERDKNVALNLLIDAEKSCKNNKDKLYTALSYMFFNFNNYRKALKYANLAILFNSKNGSAYFRKKCALDAMGKTSEANECYKKAQELGYKEEY